MKEPGYREFCPDNDTMATVRFLGVLGAGGGEATGEGIAKDGVAESVVVRRDVFLVEGKHELNYSLSW